MDAPVTSVSPTPSNFGSVVSSRALSAESTGGLYQPDAAANTNAAPEAPKEATSWAKPQKQAPTPKLGEGEPLGSSTQGTGQQEGPQDPNAPEQLYDDNGEPIDMEAYAQKRAEVMDAIQQALDEGKFPFEQLKDLPIEVPGPNGTTRQMTLEQLKQGSMREADYTRKLQDVHRLRDQAQHILNLERARNVEWKDPAQLRSGLRMLGLQESFEKAAFEYAKERVWYKSLPERERALYDQLQLQQAHNQQLREMQRQQQMLQQQQQGPDPATVHAAKQIEQLMPRALRAAGVGNYPFAQNIFVQNLKVLCDDGDITPERAAQAAAATRQFLDEIQAANGGQGVPRATAPAAQEEQPRAMPNYPLGPRRLASGGARPRPQLVMGSVMGSGSSSTNTNGGRRPSDYMRKLGFG